MSVLGARVRPGAYYDSIVLMQLQAGLASLPGVEDAGAVMATEVNLAVLEGNLLLPDDLGAVKAEDLVIVVRGASEGEATAALEQVDALLSRKRAAEADDEYRPRSLRQAERLLPEARWVLISVPGRFAAPLAREALDQGRNVFLYSDNVPVDDEVALKTAARERGLLVMGPDCGTALVGGVGFGFANRVRRGRIGVVAASGTGLQVVITRIHAQGAGISQALGTGGRDLSEAVGGASALAALDLLARDPATEVIVLVSKPPARAVANRLLAAARTCGKPVVVAFQGAAPPPIELPELTFAGSLSRAADLAIQLSRTKVDSSTADLTPAARVRDRCWLRGLFSGGTLAYEALLGLRSFLQPLASNISVDGVRATSGTEPGQGHVLLDLGSDEFTVGRLHPMIDPDLRLRRLRQEAADPEVAILFLDVVLGDGSHPDPAGAFAAAIHCAVEGGVEVVVFLVGTEEDPQGLETQEEALADAGARVFTDLSEALAALVKRLAPAVRPSQAPPPGGDPTPDPGDLAGPPALINVGLEAFHRAAQEQGATSVHVEWKPPAGGDETLLGVLEKLKRR